MFLKRTLQIRKFLSSLLYRKCTTYSRRANPQIAIITFLRGVNPLIANAQMERKKHHMLASFQAIYGKTT
jgi:hypothetical protein